MKARFARCIRRGGATPLKELIKQLNAVLAGWVQYFRVGNASRAFSEIRDYVEMKVRTLLTRRKRRHKRSVGWRRWSNEYLYDVLGLFWDWKISRSQAQRRTSESRPPDHMTHNPFDEAYWASCLRENLTSRSYGEGLETGRIIQTPRQSFTRQAVLQGTQTQNRQRRDANPTPGCRHQPFELYYDGHFGGLDLCESNGENPRAEAWHPWKAATSSLFAIFKNPLLKQLRILILYTFPRSSQIHSKYSRGSTSADARLMI